MSALQPPHVSYRSELCIGQMHAPYVPVTSAATKKNRMNKKPRYNSIKFHAGKNNELNTRHKLEVNRREMDKHLLLAPMCPLIIYNIWGT